MKKGKLLIFKRNSDIIDITFTHVLSIFAGHLCA